MIFTLPAELHPLWRFNRERLAELLFTAVHRTLGAFSADPKYLAAMPGVMSCLHTWGRDLSLHPHLHCLLTHGGLNEAGDWIAPRKAVLFPQKPLMMVYRGKLLGRKAWVVHCCQRYDHASGVAKYLARYIKGGPLRNSQLLSVSPSQVRFRYQSHRTHGSAVAQLTMATFIQRWLEHVPTPGKASIRYLGLYSSGGRRKLNLARQ
ncbi:transposase, partial [Pseudaeromonas pectinilytica]